jgi:hypothetical protein
MSVTACNSNLPVTGRQCLPSVGSGDVNVTRWLFFSGIIYETIQLHYYAGFSEENRSPRALDSVPFVERFARKMNDREMQRSYAPAGGTFEISRCTP